ncbi:VOC family protein, partial [Streptomyces sp. SID7982]|nr:VOC family protein [Streptomyces sp. SID7982]
RIGETSANLAACLDRFQGLHILMFSSPAIEEAAVRLTEAGVRHGGVNTVRRAAPSGADSPVETIRYLEIEGQEPITATAPGTGTVPEGRVGVVAGLDPGIQSARHLDHPNGATALAEATLCVADEAWPPRTTGTRPTWTAARVRRAGPWSSTSTARP